VVESPKLTALHSGFSSVKATCARAQNSFLSGLVAASLLIKSVKPGRRPMGKPGAKPCIVTLSVAWLKAQSLRRCTVASERNTVQRRKLWAFNHATLKVTIQGFAPGLPATDSRLTDLIKRLAATSPLRKEF
jgi:hypothetical protein